MREREGEGEKERKKKKKKRKIGGSSVGEESGVPAGCLLAPMPTPHPVPLHCVTRRCIYQAPSPFGFQVDGLLEGTGRNLVGGNRREARVF